MKRINFEQVHNNVKEKLKKYENRRRNLTIAHKAFIFSQGVAGSLTGVSLFTPLLTAIPLSVFSALVTAKNWSHLERYIEDCKVKEYAISKMVKDLYKVDYDTMSDRERSDFIDRYYDIMHDDIPFIVEGEYETVSYRKPKKAPDVVTIMKN